MTSQPVNCQTVKHQFPENNTRSCLNWWNIAKIKILLIRFELNKGAHMICFSYTYNLIYRFYPIQLVRNIWLNNTCESNLLLWVLVPINTHRTINTHRIIYQSKLSVKPEMYFIYIGSFLMILGLSTFYSVYTYHMWYVSNSLSLSSNNINFK